MRSSMINVWLDVDYIIERCLIMEDIITQIYNLIKDTKDLISYKEQVKVLMYETFAALVSETFTHLNKLMKEKAREKKYLVERNDSRTIQFSFGAVTYQRTLFKDVHDNKSIYLLDEWLEFRKYQRYSPLVDVRVEVYASESNYREYARILIECTHVSMRLATLINCYIY